LNDYLKYTTAPYASFEGFRIGIPRAQLEDVPFKVTEAIYAAGQKMKGLGATLIDPADMLLTKPERIRLNLALNAKLLMDFEVSMDRYLGSLRSSPVRSTKELVAFNDVSCRLAKLISTRDTPNPLERRVTRIGSNKP
jgi:hypothetical protein